LLTKPSAVGTNTQDSNWATHMGVHRSLRMHIALGRRSKTPEILLGEKDNVATMQLSPVPQILCQPTNNNQDPIIMQPATAISDNKDKGETKKSMIGTRSCQRGRKGQWLEGEEKHQP
jgi:hypothetical protein